MLTYRPFPKRGLRAAPTTLYELGTLRKLRDWDRKIPRFLFRGFTENSGGNKELNTPTAITPHAFLGKFVDSENDQSGGSGADAIPGSRREFSPSSPTALDAMSLEEFRSEINEHLSGNKNMVSHFSSWTADLRTAERFAKESRLDDIYIDTHIGILDTSCCDDANVILHVRALREEGHTKCKYDYEYLVYGQVKGISYTCMSASCWQSTSSYPPPYTSWPWWSDFMGTIALSEIREAYNRAGCCSFYCAAVKGPEVRWGPCKDTALFLTIIAAKWSGYSMWLFDKNLVWSNSSETEEWWQARFSDLRQVIEWAAKDTTLVLPLVNPYTHRAGIPSLELMVKLLRYFEAEIIKLRSKPPSGLWSFTRFLLGQN